ncbi:hypothetical protein TNCV_2864551 [Trichonephila clavipes]|nr:hypothetical protein TNCV_2864551 [Trichonephila clavipes]
MASGPYMTPIYSRSQTTSLWTSLSTGTRSVHPSHAECIETRSSSAIGRQGSMSRHSIRCPGVKEILKVFKFEKKLVACVGHRKKKLREVNYKKLKE